MQCCWRQILARTPANTHTNIHTSTRASAHASTHTHTQTRIRRNLKRPDPPPVVCVTHSTLSHKRAHSHIHTHSHMQMLLPTVAGSQDLPSYNGIVTGWTEVTKEVLAAQAAADGAEVHTPNTRSHTYTPLICSRPYVHTYTHVYALSHVLSLLFALSLGLLHMHSPPTIVCSFLRAYMQIYTHIYIQAYRRTYISTNTHT